MPCSAVRLLDVVGMITPSRHFEICPQSERLSGGRGSHGIQFAAPDGDCWRPTTRGNIGVMGAETPIIQLQGPIVSYVDVRIQTADSHRRVASRWFGLLRAS